VPERWYSCLVDKRRGPLSSFVGVFLYLAETTDTEREIKLRKINTRMRSSGSRLIRQKLLPELVPSQNHNFFMFEIDDQFFILVWLNTCERSAAKPVDLFKKLNILFDVGRCFASQKKTANFTFPRNTKIFNILHPRKLFQQQIMILKLQILLFH
jgi:hypothetical protein